MVPQFGQRMPDIHRSSTRGRNERPHLR
jgi:hypothetical protein